MEFSKDYEDTFDSYIPSERDSLITDNFILKSAPRHS